MLEVRRLAPSTVSRRVSIVAGCYCTCVIDGRLSSSPAEHVRRPRVPTESPTLGLTHLQFEAMLQAARLSANPFDFALVAMLGLLGLRVSRSCSADIADLGEEHGRRILEVYGKGDKIVLVPLPPAVSRAIDRAVGDRTAGRSSQPAQRADEPARRHPAAAVSRRQRRHPGQDAPHMLRHTCVTRCWTPGWTCAMYRSPPDTPTRAPTMRYDRARKNLDRHANYILAAFMASGT
jgi:integrase